MASLNRVTLIGNLGQNPVLRTTHGGHEVAKLRMATNEIYLDDSKQKQTVIEWHDVECWGKLAKNAAEYLTKGRLVYVEGALRTDRWEKDGQKHLRTKIVASRVTFLDRPDQLQNVGEEPRVEAPAG